MARPKKHEERRVSTYVRIPESPHDRLVEAAQDRRLTDAIR
jgi:hypothetical protein